MPLGRFHRVKLVFRLILFVFVFACQQSYAGVILTGREWTPGAPLVGWKPATIEEFTSYVSEYNLTLSGGVLPRTWMRIEPDTLRVTVRRKLINCTFGTLSKGRRYMRFVWDSGLVEYFDLLTNWRQFRVLPRDPTSGKQLDYIRITKVKDYSHELPCKGLVS
jgi:hypothetical protein